VARISAHDIGQPRLSLTATLPAPLGNVLLVGAWLALSRHTLAWLFRRLAEPGARTNGILLAAAVTILVVRAWPTMRLRALALAPPRAHLLPLTLFVLCALAQAGRVWLLGSNLLASIAFAVGTHALLGLYLPTSLWRRGFVVVLALAALLPFGPHIDAFLGFPARVVTAHLVRHVLAALGMNVQSTEDIVILENGVASIDLPCSGVKGLWIGGMFFLALTWLERRALGRSWFVVGLVVFASLATANFLRVLLLVVIGFGCRLPEVASLVHLPLGVFGFVVACGLAVLLVHRLPTHGRQQDAGAALARPLGAGLLPLLAVLFFLAGRSAYARTPAHPVAVADLRLPQAWHLTKLSLEGQEAQLFMHHGARLAGKWQFRADGTAGTLLVVVADSFRAHHAPEICLAGAGHKIDGVRRVALGPHRPFHLIDIDGHRASAATWFQSARTMTDSLMRRTLAEFLDGEQRWALVSVLFEQPVRLDATTRALLGDLHASVAASLASSRSKGM
jgi:exosortase O